VEDQAGEEEVADLKTIYNNLRNFNHLLFAFGGPGGVGAPGGPGGLAAGGGIGRGVSKIEFKRDAK
jgi:hypothetical protein